MKVYKVIGYFYVTDEAKLMAAAAEHFPGWEHQDASDAILTLFDPGNLMDRAWGVAEAGATVADADINNETDARFIDNAIRLATPSKEAAE